ncbi:MAG: amidase [Calditrichota bacterium]
MIEESVFKLSITEVALRIKSREISPVELTETALTRLDRLQPKLNSFITILAEQAMAQAKERERELIQGKYRGPLHGIPIGLKDNLATAGIQTTIGSKIFKGNIPAEDAFVVERVKEAGAIILGKENLHEFAMGVSSNNPHFGAVHNPWDPDCVPGGSSGGSAANVAACLTFASLGSDAGGSVRTPASVCGVVGLKPTYGRVSQRGLLSSNFGHDHVGPITRSVADSALMLGVIAGHDPMDATSAEVPVPRHTVKGYRLKSLRMGIPKNYYFEQLDPEVESAVKQAVDALSNMGIEPVEVELPSLQYALILRIISAAENLVAHENLIRTHRADYGQDVLYRMLPTQFMTAGDLARCFKVQRVIIDDFSRALEEADFLVAPTTPIPAYPIKAKTVSVKGKELPTVGPGRSASLLGRNCYVTNHTGNPSLSVPCGFTVGGLPIGLQLIGRPFEEGLLFRVAGCYEQTSPARGKQPAVAG